MANLAVSHRLLHLTIGTFSLVEHQLLVGQLFRTLNRGWIGKDLNWCLRCGKFRTTLKPFWDRYVAKKVIKFAGNMGRHWTKEAISGSRVASHFSTFYPGYIPDTEFKESTTVEWWCESKKGRRICPACDLKST